MSARVFISHRRDEGAGLATALAEELEAHFGDGQVARLDADAASGERWREALAGTTGGVPVLLVVVASDLGATPADAAAAQGREPTGDDPLRALLDAGLATGAHLLPVLGEGSSGLPAGEDLPPPFERLSRLPRRALRSAEWTGDVARIAEDLRELGVRPLAGTQPGTMPLPLPPPRDGPTTTPMPLDEGGPELAAADGGRRGMLGMATVALLLVGGWGVWRWQQRRAANLSGVWHGRIGLRGAPTSREGGLMLVTLAQKNRQVGLSSTVGIENDPQWEGVRDAWKERTGDELKQVVYRGEGEFIEEGDTATRAASVPAAAASDTASAALTKADAERTRRIDPTLGMRRVVIAVRIAAPGAGGERIDEGVFRGVVDLGDQRIHGRLWLESEQAERVVDLRRGD